jgi:lipopolysaccharide export LptBFGC system permease protein LptF
MWTAFRYIFGAVLGYFFAMAFIIALIFAGVALIGGLTPVQQQHYHVTKAKPL